MVHPEGVGISLGSTRQVLTKRLTGRLDLRNHTRSLLTFDCSDQRVNGVAILAKAGEADLRHVGDYIGLSAEDEVSKAPPHRLFEIGLE